MTSEIVRSLAFTIEDIDALLSAVSYTLATEIKTGQHKKRIKLYSLQRRLTRARLDLER